MELIHCINYLLITAQHKVFQEMSASLEPYGVTPVQYGVLYCLWTEKARTPKEIATILQLENSTISGVLDRMEKKELLERRVSLEDRRFIEVILTEKGKSLEEPILKTVENVNYEIMSALPEDDQIILKDTLKILAGLDKVEIN